MGTAKNQLKNKTTTLACFPKSTLCVFLPSVSIFVFIVVFYRSWSPSFLSVKDLHTNSNLQCGRTLDPSTPSGEKYLWFAPHSGFSNQVAELKNAILVAAILNRTLIVPPVLDHHAVALGSCPKFRVENAVDLRVAVWRNVVQMIRNRRYISIADIIDLSSLKSSSLVKTIDLRVFGQLWCHTDMSLACTGELCCGMSGRRSTLRSFEQCGSLLSALNKATRFCAYGVEEDCRTTVWTYQQGDESLDSFQPNKELQTKKKISYVRKRRDVYKALGPGSEADEATVLSFGSLFTAPYKGSELYIDIHAAPRSSRIQSLLNQIEFLPFVPEIVGAGKSYALNVIRSPFLCAQLRLLDGQFKNHWKSTFASFQNMIQMIKDQNGGGSHPIHIFVMTDLPSANWTGTYLGDLAGNQKYSKLYNLHEGDELVIQTAKKVLAAERGIRSGFFPYTYHETSRDGHCPSVTIPDILLYIEEMICSCASLGFVGTSGSTIAENIELMRKNNVCLSG